MDRAARACRPCGAARGAVVTSSGQCRLEKRLRLKVGNGRGRGGAVASVNRGGATHRSLDIRVGRGELLPAQLHHVRHSIQVDVLQLIMDPAADATHFQRKLVGKLMLDSEIVRIYRVGAQMRVGIRGGERLHVTVDTRIKGLWQILGWRRRRWEKWGGIAVGADAEGIRRVKSTAGQASSAVGIRHD